MAQHKLPAGKRFAKPVLFGTIIVGLATAFFNSSEKGGDFDQVCGPIRAHRHWFLEDVEELRAQERARYDARRIEVLQRRERQLAELSEKKKGGSS